MVAVIALQRHVLFRCLLVPMACTQGCSKQVPKQEMDRHIVNECPLTPMPCLLANTGCKEMIPRQDLHRHLEKNIVQHVLAMNELIKQRDEAISSLRKDVSLLVNNKNFVTTFDENEDEHSLKFRVNLWDFTNLSEISEFSFKIPGYPSLEGYFNCPMEGSNVGFFFHLSNLEDGRYKVYLNFEKKISTKASKRSYTGGYGSDCAFVGEDDNWGWPDFICAEDQNYAFISGSIRVSRES